MKQKIHYLFMLLLMIIVGAGGVKAQVSWIETSATDLKTGDVVVIVDKTSASAMSNDKGTSSAPTATAVSLKSLNNEKTEITSNVATTLQWVVTVNDDKTYCFGVSGTETSLYCTNTNNGVRVGKSDNIYFSIHESKWLKVNVKGNNGSYKTRYLGVYNKQDWRCYENTTGNISGTVTAFYKKVESGPSAEATTLTIDASGITNTDVYKGTAAGSLSATVEASGNAVSGATVAWESSNPGVATIDGNGYVTLEAAGITTITATYAGEEGKYEGSSATYTLIVTNSTPATLPFNWEGGISSELNALNGVTTNDLGSDYAKDHDPYYVKFDSNGDYIQVKTDGQPGKVSIGVKMIGGDNTSSITVQGSSDGEIFKDIETLSISGSQNDELTLTTTNGFAETDRYVRLVFTKGSNVGVGPISIAKPLSKHTATFYINGDETSTEIAEGSAITFPADPADINGKSFVGWTTAPIKGTLDTAPETLVTAATMGNADVTYYAVYAAKEGEGVSNTATLTNADIVAAGEGKTGYNFWTITDSNDRKWNAHAVKNQHSNATSGYHYLQIKKSTDSEQFYIQVPEMGGTITAMTMTVSGSSQPMTDGNNSSTLFFSNSNLTSATGNGVVSSGGASTVTLNCSSLGLNTGYITSSGAVRIWDVKVTYGTPATYSDYCTTVVEPVAEVGGKKYESLEAAFAAANDGATVTLLKDVELSEGITNSGNAVLDLNGHDITGMVNGKLITNSGTLTIQGSGHIYNKDVTAQGHDAVYNTGTLTIAGGVFGDADDDQTNANGQNRGAAVRNFGGAVTINGGSYTACDNFTNGGYAYALINDNNGSMTINDANVYGKNNGNIANNYGTVTVKGGSFTLNNASSYYSLYVDGEDGVAKTIVEGGTFNNTSNNGLVHTDDANNASIEISGGDFTYTKLTNQTNEALNAAVSGGTFSSPVPAEFCAEGYIPADLGEGKYGVKAGAYVAQVDNVSYETLEAAFAAAQDGATVTMLDDVTLTGNLVLALEGKAVTLDLNKKTLNGRTNLTSGSLTVKNGTVNCEGGQPLNVYGSATAGAENHSVLTVAEDVNVSGNYGVCLFGAPGAKDGYGAVANIAGTVSGKEGTVFVSGNLGNNIAGDMNNVINITGKVYGNEDAAVALNGNATVNVKSGAEITGNTGIAVKRGVLNVEDGATVHGTGAENLTPGANNNGTEMTGAAVSMTDTYNNYGAMAVNITGGTFTSDHAAALFKEDGTYANAATFAVSGGTFSSPVPAEFCAQGYIPADLGEGKYGVKAGAYVAQVDNVSYETLEAAFAAAQDGATVTMLDDVTLTGNLVLALEGKAVTLDLNKKTLNGRTNLTSGSLTVKNGTVNCEGGQPLNVYGSATAGAENHSVLTVAEDVNVSGNYGVCLFGAPGAKDGYGAVANIAGTVSGKEGTVFVSGNLGNNIAGDMNNVINITGKVYGNEDAAVALNGNATVNVKSGAEITGNTGIAVKRGVLNVEDGATVHGTGAENLTPGANNNGTEMTGAAVSMTDTYNNYGAMSVNITGGTFTSDKTVALFKEDGTYANAATYAVSGGTFSSAVPAEFCAEGYIPTDLGDGKYGVKLYISAPIIFHDSGEYEEKLTVTIAGENVKYTLNDREAQTYTAPIDITANTTIKAWTEQDGATSDVVTREYTIVPKANGAVVEDGYYTIQNKDGKYVNVAGRKTVTLVSDTKSAGTVIRVKADEDGVKVLRSQAVDLPRYAERAMSYVPELVKEVVKKLAANVNDPIIGEQGADLILDKFNKEFDYHLYLEGENNTYRIYGRTPSMKPVVDFYAENKELVDSRLPKVEGFVEEILLKVADKLGHPNSEWASKFKIHDIWALIVNEENKLTEPVDEASTAKFFTEVLSSEANIWNFAHETAMIYWDKVKSYLNDNISELGDYGKYIEKIPQIRPNFKYYIVPSASGVDIISEGNSEIKNASTAWTLTKRDGFDVTFDATLSKNNGKEMYKTLYVDFAYELPENENVKALKVTDVTEAGVAVTEEITGVVPAQTPVLLMSTDVENLTKTLKLSTADGEAVTGNLLVGADALINEYDINSPTAEGMFTILATLSQSLADKYEYLQRKNAGTVNNKYFFGLTKDDLKLCYYLNDNEEKDCVVRSLSMGDEKLGFYNNWTAKANEAFLVSETFNSILLTLKGDVYRDGVIDNKDLTALVEIVLGKVTLENKPENYDFDAAHVNEDEDINIADVTALVNILKSQPQD